MIAEISTFRFILKIEKMYIMKSEEIISCEARCNELNDDKNEIH